MCFICCLIKADVDTKYGRKEENLIKYLELFMKKLK